MRLSHLSAGIVALATGITSAASTFKPTRAPAYPLLVRSPYLNSWLQGESGGLLPGSWPRFWTGQILGWQGFVAVDGATYNWMGAAPGPQNVDQVSVEYTSTKTIFTFDVAGAVTLTATFLSPVYPDDLAKQSQQFSYVSLKAKSSDGAAHSVQVYMDVTGEWTSGDLSQTVNWEFGTSGDVSYHKFFRANQQVFTESGEIASWGTWYLATSSADGLTQRSGFADDVRAQFVDKNVLDNSADSQFRAVNDRWPVFAFARDLGRVNDQEEEVVFSLGLVQDEVISFAGTEDGMTSLPGLWSAFYENDADAMTAFYSEYSDALKASDALDDKIQRDSVAAAGQDYATITTLAVRQAFGALQFAGSSSKPYIFLKEISSNSDIQTVDVIFPAYPILLYLNPDLLRYLLEPLYENQESGRYPNKYAIHDLGTFPVARGYPDGNDEAMPLEECGNMIIMTLAYANRSGDIDYLSQHYSKLSQWAEFLVEDSLIPANQLSTDDFAGTLANQTNLALKGIIGLKAMSRIARLTGNDDTFGATADDYLRKWQGFAINTDANPPHTTLSYGDNSSHGLLYNLYADRLLSLDFVPQSIYDMQSDFYKTVALEYGVPLDTRHTWTKSDWEMFCAAIAKPDTRALFISLLAKWIGQTNTNRAMTDLYDAGTGGYPAGGPTFVARPVQGGTFALLALP
ncbi:hypothetical protein VTK73DRAFT_1489 [Phialemonium thermophilum]|uniref:Glutaminase GtaA n=1 Tax=Phialemonium thermophilum TaxID=223376 RepID=A0ABR3X9U9_9PEZI